MKLTATDKDSDLLSSFKNGDRQAFDNVFRLYHPPLLFFANRLLYYHENIDAQEIVQDSFLKLFDRKESFQTLQAIKSFLYIVTKNSCLQKIEREKVRTRRFEKYISDYDESEDAILSHMVYSEVLSALHQAIESLPPQCRIIMKKFMDGKTANEIAAEMEISLSTVNNQKSRGVSLLKTKLSSTLFSLLLLFI